MNKRTPIQKYKAIYEFIISFKKEHDGNSPTIRQISAAIGNLSFSLVSRDLDRMEILGMIKRSEFGHNISIPGGAWLTPTEVKKLQETVS